MGGVLSAPITSQFVERHGNEFVRTAVVSVQGFRNDMEDAHNVVLDGFKAHPSFMQFGVYDGHGGKDAAIFMHDNCPTAFRKLKDPFSQDELTQTILDLDERFLSTPTREHGSTACMVVAQPVDIDTNKPVESASEVAADKLGLRLLAVNVGDSRAMVIRRDGSWLALTQDHKPDNADERMRILDAQGHVTSGRVDGNLALSRAVGDYAYKANKQLDSRSQKVIAVPDYQTHVLQPHDLLFVCCDGIFEQLGYEDVVRILLDELASTGLKDDASWDLAQVLSVIINASIAAGSRDNHTAMLVEIGDGTKYTTEYDAREFVAGPYHRHADDPGFDDAYRKDLAANGYDFDEMLPRIIAFEKEHNLPTTKSTSSRPRPRQTSMEFMISEFMRYAHAAPGDMDVDLDDDEHDAPDLDEHEHEHDMEGDDDGAKVEEIDDEDRAK
jgi:serine/threonine protein phosphatase PrpC